MTDRVDPHLLTLPTLILDKIFNCFTYEELSQIRKVSKTIKGYSERSLNEGFSRLGRQLSTSSASLKKQLPKKESKRRSHPMNRYAEIFSTLETRYTLLSMTYKKYIDLDFCCFIPGKVLDMAFGIVRQLNGYLANNQSARDLDVIGILCDLRDYSSMAMEHFDEHIAPLYPNNRSILSIPSNFLRPSSSGKFSLPQILPKYFTGAHDNSHQSQKSDFNDSRDSSFLEEEFEALKTEVRNRLGEQDRLIDEQREALADQNETIKEQRRFISQIINLLGQISKEDSLSPRLTNKISDLSTTFYATHKPRILPIPGFDSEEDSDTETSGPPEKRMRTSILDSATTTSNMSKNAPKLVHKTASKEA